MNFHLFHPHPIPRTKIAPNPLLTPTMCNVGKLSGGRRRLHDQPSCRVSVSSFRLRGSTANTKRLAELPAGAGRRLPARGQLRLGHLYRRRQGTYCVPSRVLNTPTDLEEKGREGMTRELTASSHASHLYCAAGVGAELHAVPPGGRAGPVLQIRLPADPRRTERLLTHAR